MSTTFQLSPITGMSDQAVADNAREICHDVLDDEDKGEGLALVIFAGMEEMTTKRLNLQGYKFSQLQADTPPPTNEPQPPATTTSDSPTLTDTTTTDSSSSSTTKGTKK